MFQFLNVTTPEAYFQLYCNNPPDDSCTFGYCPNSDIAGPAVRIATYVSTICLSVVVLYSPEDMADAFYGQLLQMYSLLIAAVIAIAARQLSRLHVIFVLLAVSSPLSLYLTIHAIRRSIIRRDTRLKPVFGYEDIPEGEAVRFRWSVWRARLNRALVLVIIPFWFAVLVISLKRRDWFNQRACDDLNNGNLTDLFFLGPVLLLYGKSIGTQATILAPFVALVLAWIGALVIQRELLFKKGELPRPWLVWRKTKRRYPFLMFCTVIAYPSAIWIAMLESGADFSNESFQPSYGQLLAIFVAVPPFLNCIYMWKDFRDWVLDLTWVRYASSHTAEPLRRQRSDDPRRDRGASMGTLGSYRQISDPAAAEEGDAMWMKDMGKGSAGTTTKGAFMSTSPKGTIFSSPSSSNVNLGGLPSASYSRTAVEDPFDTKSYHSRENSEAGVGYTRKDTGTY